MINGRYETALLELEVHWKPIMKSHNCNLGHLVLCCDRDALFRFRWWRSQQISSRGQCQFLCQHWGGVLGYLILSFWRFDFQISFHKWLPITLSTSNARAPNSQLPVVHSSAILVSYSEMFPTLIHQKCLKKRRVLPNPAAARL